MAIYCAKFIPNFSDTVEPLRELTKENAKFRCSEWYEQSFNEIKELLATAKVMAYFNPNKETELVTDTSSSGLSAILMQSTPGEEDTQVVAYFSRVLTDVERCYLQTERALAIIWAVKRLHLYLYDGDFKLITDCKPVQLIFSNPKSKPPSHIERWNLWL